MRTIKKTNKSLYHRVIAWAIFVSITGLYLLFDPNSFKDLPSYQFQRAIIPITAWGIAFTVAGLGLLAGIILSLKYRKIRIFITISAVLYSMWAVGFTIAFIITGAPTLVAASAYGLIAFYGFYLISEEPHGTNIQEIVEKS